MIRYGRRASLQPSLLTTAMLAVLLGAATQAQAGDPLELSEWLPEWEEGLYWEVETTPLSFAQPKATGGPVVERSDRKITVRFEVTGRKEIKGNSCYELTITNDLQPAMVRVLYVREIDYTLAEHHSVRGKGESESRTVTPHGRGAFVLLEETFLCPLDVPSFPAEAKDEKLESKLSGSSLALIEERRFERRADGAELFHVRMETELNGKPLVSLQSWHKGAPWYTEAKRTIDGRDTEIGKLIKIGYVEGAGPDDQDGGEGDGGGD